MISDAREIITTLDAVPGQDCKQPAELPFHDFTPVVVTLGPIAIAFAVVYITNGEGMGGRNAAKYAELAVMVKQLRIPWMLIGDWNVSPGAVTASSWLRFIGGVIEVPRGGAHSCTSGKGNPLNFAVMRPDVKSKLLLRFDLDFEVPWKLHAGLRLVLKAPRDVIPVRVPLTAPCPELPALARNKRDAFEPSRPACMWQARVASATSAMTAKCSSPAKMSLRYVATGDAAEELGQRYVIFICSVERYIYGQFNDRTNCLAIDAPHPPSPWQSGWMQKGHLTCGRASAWHVRCEGKGGFHEESARVRCRCDIAMAWSAHHGPRFLAPCNRCRHVVFTSVPDIADVRAQVP